MPHNPNPFTALQLKMLDEIRRNLIEIRDPHKEVLDNRSYEFYIEHTKKFGSIPKIRFKPNSMAVKAQIMKGIGYRPLSEKNGWKAARNAAASTFDKAWDNLMVRLIKAGRVLAAFNQNFTVEGQSVSELIRLVQGCIGPHRVDGSIADPDTARKSEPRSYMKKLAEVE